MNVTRKGSLGEAIVVLLYFALKPLYLGASGSLQISDIVLLLSLGYLIIKEKGRIRFGQKYISVIKVFTYMLIYQAIVNVIWSIITGDEGMNRHDLYYIFNYFAFVGCIYIGENVGIDNVKQAIGIGSFFAVLVTAVGLLLFRGLGSRSTGFFNNPNQLGYFAVIMLTVIALCKDYLNKLQVSTILFISFWSAIASLSKAAIIAYFAEIIMLILFYQNNRSVKRLAAELGLLLIIGVLIYLLFYSNNRMILGNRTLLQMRYRIKYMAQENDSGLAYGRGYARVWEMLPHILWGTGEGAYDRFVVKHATEVHSTFISLLTCYGLIGLFGYLYIFKKCLGSRKQFFQSMTVMLGLFLYAMTHNGIRNTLLWMILALLLLNTNQSKNLKKY